MTLDKLPCDDNAGGRWQTGRRQMLGLAVGVPVRVVVAVVGAVVVAYVPVLERRRKVHEDNSSSTTVTDLEVGTWPLVSSASVPVRVTLTACGRSSSVMFHLNCAE